MKKVGHQEKGLFYQAVHETGCTGHGVSLSLSLSVSLTAGAGGKSESEEAIIKDETLILLSIIDYLLPKTVVLNLTQNDNFLCIYHEKQIV